MPTSHVDRFAIRKVIRCPYGGLFQLRFHMTKLERMNIDVYVPARETDGDTRLPASAISFDLGIPGTQELITALQEILAAREEHIKTRRKRDQEKNDES